MRSFKKCLKMYEEILILTCLFVSAAPLDNLLTQWLSNLPPKSLWRASDSLLHGVIGALSWMWCLVRCPSLSFLGDSHRWININLSFLFDCVIAFSIATIIDVDHIFPQILYMNFKDIEWRRSWLHFSLPPMVIFIILCMTSMVYKKIFHFKVGSLLLVCTLSHHLRDALHHGLWIQPLIVTPLFPKWLCVTTIMCLPLLMAIGAKHMVARLSKAAFVFEELQVV